MRKLRGELKEDGHYRIVVGDFFVVGKGVGLIAVFVAPRGGRPVYIAALILCEHLLFRAQKIKEQMVD